MSLLIDFFSLATPDPRIWLVALIVGVPLALLLGWAARAFKFSSAPIAYFLVVLISAGAYFFLVITFVYSDGEHSIIGGISMTSGAAEFMESQGATMLDTIGAFDGWNNPDAVWRSSGRRLVSIAMFLFASLMTGAFLAFVLRYSKSLAKLLPERIRKPFD